VKPWPDLSPDAVTLSTEPVRQVIRSAPFDADAEQPPQRRPLEHLDLFDPLLAGVVAILGGEERVAAGRARGSGRSRSRG
jgi:hypothetical protein